jgi:hypothetical protein
MCLNGLCTPSTLQIPNFHCFIIRNGNQITVDNRICFRLRTWNNLQAPDPIIMSRLLTHSYLTLLDQITSHKKDETYESVDALAGDCFPNLYSLVTWAANDELTFNAVSHLHAQPFFQGWMCACRHKYHTFHHMFMSPHLQFTLSRRKVPQSDRLPAHWLG